MFAITNARSRNLVAAVTMLAAGCSAMPMGVRKDDLTSPTVRVSAIAAGIVDRRSEFAKVFSSQPQCHGPAEQALCNRALWLASTPDPASPLPAVAAAYKITLVVIEGILGECVREHTVPFGDAADTLTGAGVTTVLRPPIEGRSSSLRNGAIIDAYLAEQIADRRDVVVVAYSKGLVDFAEALARPGSPTWKNSIRAVISVAGVVNGTPVANRTARLYQHLTQWPIAACPPGDGGGVISLMWDANRGDALRELFGRHRVATYSIASVSETGRVNPILKPFHTALSRVDERNDGQVYLEDALLPGSSLLAIAKADHWSIALPFEASTDPRARVLARHNSFPRAALIGAALNLVVSDFEQ